MRREPAESEASKARRAVDERIRDAYEGGETYKLDTVSARPRSDAQDYAGRLLDDKITTIRRYARPGLLVDLCCGTGEHLFALSDLGMESVGIDFSRPFIRHARAEAEKRDLNRAWFEVGDARALPLADSSVSTLYSLSSLYAIPGLDEAMAEISRVLRPGGRCILDLANSRSLNAICVRAYTELPPTFHITVTQMKRLCRKNGLRILEHRRFQLLPLWAGKPRWMWPLLHPAWKTVMSRRIGGRMIDEWISSAPLLRRFAFRHVIVCEKAVNGLTK
jgi:SAM-dependent methyltransferase